MYRRNANNNQQQEQTAVAAHPQSSSPLEMIAVENIEAPAVIPTPTLVQKKAALPPKTTTSIVIDHKAWLAVFLFLFGLAIITTVHFAVRDPNLDSLFWDSDMYTQQRYVQQHQPQIQNPFKMDQHFVL